MIISREGSNRQNLYRYTKPDDGAYYSIRKDHRTDILAPQCGAEAAFI